MNTSNDTAKVRTVGEWLFGCVNFAVPEETAIQIAEDRNIPFSADSKEVAKNILRLMKADLQKWYVLGAGKVNDTKDSDNGWSHSGGGYTLSEFDKKLLIKEANKVYVELEPESVFGKTRIRMHSAGIMPTRYDADGNPIPRKPL
ncbi:MAG: hypothetical protein K6F47_00850 [Bacteroidaceae bacterium]|nr:hypothetical protein [Bacteroidaceae bacterium]